MKINIGEKTNDADDAGFVRISKEEFRRVREQCFQKGRSSAFVFLGLDENDFPDDGETFVAWCP